ncbi:MAG: ABC transporter ATP-binding protein [Burkholderiales bacterium]|nr:ABC transporter ATP-binding protein [Burkholderiales bacterium]
MFPVAALSHAWRGISMIRFSRDLQSTLYLHVQRLSADFFHRHKVGEIAARTSGDIDAIGNSAGAVGSVVYSVVILVQSLVMMCWLSMPLTGVFVVMMVLVTAISHCFLPKIRKRSRAHRDAAGEASAALTEYISIQDLIRSFSREDMAYDKVQSRITETRRRAERLTWTTSIFYDLLTVLMQIAGPVALLLTGAWLIAQGRLSVGDLTAFWGYWVLMGGGVMMVLSNITAVYSGMASADRVFDFLYERPMIEDAPQAVVLDRVAGEIVFDGVNFNYPTESDQTVLRDVSFRIAPGQRVAFVGPSGAGKSTILQLVLRIYDPLTGGIRVDGTDLRQIRQDSLRRNVGMVMQESVFFSGTIADNLRFARPDATEAQMIAALENASAWSFVRDMPGGLHAVIGERGAKLSGGQKQRLSISRVFLKDPPIVLFDEATSALDSISEKLVQEAMERLMSGRTTLIVAHRIATVRSADVIFILQDGRITASGPHSELIEKSPLYYELHAHQSR